MVRLFTLSFLLVLNNIVSSQDIKGIVMDSVTQSPIPFVNLYNAKLEVGTTTNSEGEFVLEKQAEGVELIFSHIAYQTKKILLKKKGENLQITLSPNTIQLPELTISDEGYKIAKKAYEKLIQDQPKMFGKAFYRQVTRTDDSPKEFIETFNKVEFDQNGISRYSIDEARYGRTKSSKENVQVFINNFSYFSFGLSLARNSTTKKNQLSKPFTPDYFDSYYYQVRGYYQQNGIKYAIIDFEPMENVKGQAISGTFTVNLFTNGVINFKAVLNQSVGIDSLNLKQNGKQVKIPARNHHINWIVDFEDKSTPVLNYINVSVSFEFTLKETDRRSQISSTLVVFEKDSKKKKGLKEADIKQIDIERVRKKKYNPNFWKDNPIIKRTKFEDDAILSFEKSNSFGSYIDQ